MAPPSGMGMSKTKSKKGGGGGGSNNSKGMGKRTSTEDTKFDVAKAWTKLQKSYDEIMSESNTSSKTNSGDDNDDDDNWDESTMEITTEYIVTARCKSSALPSPSASDTNISNNNNINSAYRSSSDWIPVAQVCIVRPIHLEETDNNAAHHREIIASPPQATISYYCREISYAATLAAPILKSLPRNLIEYGYEPIDSFMKFVYGDVITGKTSDTYVNGDNEKVKMTKSNARQILQLEEGCTDASLIKRSYKKLSMAYHPDRFINSGKTKEEIEESTRQFTLVKMAYEALNSGVRSSNNNGGDADGVMAVNGDGGLSSSPPSSTTTGSRRSSWYESLGGKSRTEFVGPIELLSVEKASALCNKAFKCGVIGLDSDITMAFVVRNNQAHNILS